MLLVVTLICVVVPSVLSLMCKPSVVPTNEVALAVAVPISAWVHTVVLVVDAVLEIFAGANNLASASTGNIVFNPIRL